MFWKGVVNINDEMEDTEVLLPSKTYLVSRNRISGSIDELEAMKQSVEKVLLTERFEWVIYSDEYGIEFMDLIGQDFDLVSAELERIISESFSNDERILEISNIEIMESSENLLIIKFIVITVFGDVLIEQEVKS